MIAGTGLITLSVITGGISIAAFAKGVGLPVGIGLNGASLLLSVATTITCKSIKTFMIKQEKHYSIKLLAQSKLDRNPISFHKQCKTEISPLTNFTKYFKNEKTTGGSRLRLGIRQGPK